MSSPVTRRQVAANLRAIERELEQLRAMPGITVYDARPARQVVPHRELPPRSAWLPAWRRVFK